MPARRTDGLRVGLLLLLGALALGPTLRLGIFGHDSYSLILTSRVRSLSDLLDLVRRPFLDDHFGVPFWRPVWAAAVALDEALFGLWAPGYQAVSLLVFLASLAALYLLVARLSGPRGGRAALITVGLFALHPQQWEVVPVLCRRHDMLSGLFVLLALLQLERTGGARRRERWLAALFALLAVGTKESGALALPLGFTLALFRSPARGVPTRLRDAARACTPMALVMAVQFAVRVRVLGGLGGALKGSPFSLRGLNRGFDHIYFPVEIAPASVYAWIVAASLVGPLLLALYRLRLRGEARARSAFLPGALALSAVWLALVLVLLATMGGQRIASWHYFLPFMAVVLAVGSSLGFVLERWGRATTRERLGLTLAVVPGLALLVLPLSWSPHLRGTAPWREADALASAFLADLEQRIESAPDGSTLQVSDIPARGPKREGIRYQSGALLAGHSVDSWIALRFPERRVLVTGPLGLDSRIDDGVVVALDVRITDHAGVRGAFARLQRELRDEGSSGPEDAQAFKRAFAEGRPADAKELLLHIVSMSPRSRIERYHVLADYFAEIADPLHEWKALELARRRGPDHPAVLHRSPRLQELSESHAPRTAREVESLAEHELESLPPGGR